MTAIILILLVSAIVWPYGTAVFLNFLIRGALWIIILTAGIVSVLALA